MAKNIELVPQKDLDNLDKLNKALSVSRKELNDMLPALLAASKELSGFTGGYKDLTKLLERTGKLEKQVEQATKQHTIAKANYERETQRVIQAEARRDMRARIRENQAAAGSIDQLSARLERLRSTLDGMNASQTAKWGASFTNEINRIDAIVKKSDFGTGRFRRNVGNYASGFNALGFQVQQVARELPSLTVSASQFFLALSNNLPMLADQLRIATAEYAALKAQGKQGTPVWKQLIQSVLSWQTALVVGITLLTAYGKEIGAFFKRLFTGKEAAATLGKAIKNINKSLEFENLGTKIAEFEKLRKAWVALGDDANARKKFIEDYRTELDNTGIAVNNVNDADNFFIRNSQTYIQSLIMRAKAQAGVTLAAKEYETVIQEAIKQPEIDAAQERINNLQKMLKDAQKPGVDPRAAAALIDLIQRETSFINKINESKDAAQQRADAYISVVGDMSEEQRKLLESAGLEQTGDDNKGSKSLSDRISALQKLREAEIEAGQEINSFWRENQAELYKIIAENDKQNYADRLNALNMFVTSQKQAIEAARDTQVENLIAQTMKDTGLSRVAAEKEVMNQIAVINARAWNEILEIDRDGTAMRAEIDKDYTEGLIKNIAKRVEAQAVASTQSESGELTKLAQEYAKGLMSAEEYEGKKTEIARRYAGERFDAETAMLMEQLTVQGLTTEQREEIEKKLAEVGIKYRQWANGIIISDAEKLADKEKELAEQLAAKKKELLTEVFELATTLSAAQTERELAELEKREEQADEADEEEKARIERLEEAGAISKEEADARKAAIDSAASQREEAMEQRRIELQRKQAVFERNLAISQILIDTVIAVGKIKAATAVAIAGAVAASPLTGGMPWSGIIAANGAAQTALTIAAGGLAAGTAAAQLLPQYAEGTDWHPGGLAVVGDGGKSEAVLYGGKVWRTPDIPTVVDLPKGAEVLPDFKRMVAEAVSRPPRLNDWGDNARNVVVLGLEALKGDMADMKKYTKENCRVVTLMRRDAQADRIRQYYDRVTTNRNAKFS